MTAVLSNRRKKRALVISAIFLFFASIFLIQIVRAKVNYADVHVRIAREQKTLKQQKADQKQLKTQVAQLNDKNYVEQIIRDRYYYTKPGETVYSFPNKAPKDVNDYDVK
ncbi:septum formation initiator [Lentilactobacillus buchneri DSM 20057]|nr:septum formation initiator [Lentilactobacillus buchneri DSM 20057]